MNRFLTYLFIAYGCAFSPNLLLAQVNDSFDDGDFTNSPSWSGNDALFAVEAGELRSASSGAATYYLSTPSTLALNAEWQFYFNLKFSTSGANYVDIYLIADNANLSAVADGMFVRIGGTNDKIVLYKRVSGVDTELISSPNSIVNSSSNNPFRIKVTRDPADLWMLEYDDGNLGTFASTGSVVDNSVNSSSHFGILITQSSAASPVGNHFFDDIIVQEIGFDNTPPELLSLEVISENQLKLIFNEEVDQSMAENTSNYNLSGSLLPDLETAELSTPNEVILTYASSFENGSYSIQVSNIEDLKGNMIVTVDQAFDIFFPDVPEFRDVIITEIMADPSPVVQLPDAEYIELFNNSDKTFDLEGWKLSDATSTVDLPSFVFDPNGRVIICSNANTTLFESFGNVLGVPSLPSLNNTSDNISLQYNDGQLIDSVVYTDDWYGDEDKAQGGYSLELIDINNVCGGANNWIASISETGGTPGSINSVNDPEAGIALPSIKFISVLDNQQLLILMSEAIDSTSINPDNFEIDQGIIISAIRLNYDSLFVDLETPILQNTDYNLSIAAISDCTGNIVSLNNYQFELFVNPEISYRDIIINEIMANPSVETAAPSVEYIELFNNSNKSINLQNWIITDKSRSAVLPNYIFEPETFVVLTDAQNTVEFNSELNVLGLTSFPTLNNSLDSLVLIDENRKTIDSLVYSASWYRSSIKDDGGYSLELIDPDNYCAEELNWIASEDATGGTPGQLNSVFSQMTDNMGPRLENTYGLSTDSIMLIFNEKLDEQSVYNATYSFSDNLTINKIVSTDLKTIYLLLSDETPLVSGKKYGINIENLLDCPGNIIDEEFNSSDFYLIEQAVEGDILINEILFNPRPNGVDFVELINASNKYISYKGWLIANGELVNDSLIIKTARTITSNNRVLEPLSYLALTTDNIILKDQYPKSLEASFLEIPSLPSFSDDEGLVAIFNSSGQLMDYFSYSDDLHADIINDTEGVSLERISTEENTQNINNWMSAAAAENYATPGYVNSQSRNTNPIMAGEISIEPKVILPDGSGIRDFATINYSFSQAGNIANVRIFDVQGREVKRIASNDFLSTTGFYTWDGSDNNGQKAKIGYYIIFFEVFNANGDTSSFKERIVIGSHF